MENASKSLIIAATMVISVMILSLMVYLFVQAGRVPAQFEYTKQAEDVAAFNSKIEKYIVKAEIDNSTNEIIVPSNSFADVISACNFAYDLNCKNYNDNKTSLKVDINIDDDDDIEYCIFPKMDENGNTVLEKNKVFECGSNQESQMTKDNMVDLYSIMETADSEGVRYNEMKYDLQGRLRYKYYFDCDADYGLIAGSNEFENEGRITKIIFTLIKNEAY